MRLLNLSLLIALATFMFFGCQNQLTEEDTLELESIVEEQAAFGWQVTRMVSSTNEVEGLTQNSEYIEEDESPEIPSVRQLTKRASGLVAKMQTNMPSIMSLRKSSGDSLLYFEEKIVGERGTRVAFYYDFETGKARVYEVVFQFASWRNITYDSTEIKADLNSTLDNSQDDVLENLYNLQLFKDSHFVNKIESNFEITDFDGTEVTGAIGTKDAYYRPDRFLVHLKQTAQLKPDNSGTLREDFSYNDGKTAYSTVTFYADNTGSFEKKLRDGTLVSGEFNSVEDDLYGSYSETTDFPAGRFIDKIYKSATVSITLPDSIYNADYRESVYFSSGKIDSSRISIEASESDGVKTTVLNVLKPNGAHGQMQIVESAEETILNGTWTTWNEYYIILEAEYYFDGSAHIHYEVYAPPYSEGDDPVIVADYYIAPDQSGNGTLSHEGNLYNLKFEESGQATITNDGQSKTITLF